jgi:hypothetical protein
MTSRVEIKFDRNNTGHMNVLRRELPALWRSLAHQNRQPAWLVRVLQSPSMGHKLDSGERHTIDLVNAPGRYLVVKFFLPYEIDERGKPRAELAARSSRVWMPLRRMQLTFTKEKKI